MFYQPNFIRNKIVAFLNTSIDWSKKKSMLRNDFNLMRRQYSLFLFDTMEIYAKILSYFLVAKIVWIILI